MPGRIEMLGLKVGRLIVIEAGPKNEAGNLSWVCRCECGSETTVRGQLLRAGVTKSCGCLAIEKSKLRITHGQSRCGSHSPEYRSWRAMRKRCENPNYPQFHLYGGRGIGVCERWRKFQNFLADMGKQPSPAHSSIDRWPDNDGNYEPGNCRWASKEQQGRNKSNNRMVSFKGREMTFIEATELAGLPCETVRKRIDKYGWTVARALTQPVRGS